MYIITRWICDKAGGRYYQHALFYFAAFYLIELIMIAGMGTWEGAATLSYGLNVASKLAGVLAGAWFAERADSRKLKSQGGISGQAA